MSMSAPAVSKEKTKPQLTLESSVTQTQELNSKKGNLKAVRVIDGFVKAAL